MPTRKVRSHACQGDGPNCTKCGAIREHHIVGDPAHYAFPRIVDGEPTIECGYTLADGKLCDRGVQLNRGRATNSYWSHRGSRRPSGVRVR